VDTEGCGMDLRKAGVLCIQRSKMLYIPKMLGNEEVKRIYFSREWGIVSG
jgi:hypothetical protein